ncbi:MULTISPECIES: transporter [Pseudomonas]|nr:MULTISPECIES: transporter [Pseudomonas]ERV42754.1 hypothetical protein Q065_03471 [Pseudomonas aeruginosa BL11]ERY44057.1 hypothetical protein Q060_05764 [Pseudomonas aeruginosa BL06]KRV32189.1 hypothetical protein AN460_14330 [Pseudomonas aeruginosa]MCT5235697.1 transporter [Pseudomonas aeruginosa]MCV6434625.1 transporter [Pseudomonas aeruginosa]
MGIELYGMGVLPPPGTYGQVFVGNWGLDNGWVVGVGGHAYKQISDGKQDGHLVGDSNRGSTFSIGPAVQYASKDGWLLSAKWQDESGVRNPPEGQT